VRKTNLIKYISLSISNYKENETSFGDHLYFSLMKCVLQKTVLGIRTLYLR